MQVGPKLRKDMPPATRFSESGVEVVLRDGSTIHVRPLRPSDLGALTFFYESLSDESRYMRFFSAARSFDTVIKRFVELDADSGFGLVALSVGTPTIAGFFVPSC